MGRDTLPFDQPRRAKGSTESAWDRQLHAWLGIGWLGGDENAAIRNVIRSAARNVDAAQRDPDTSHYVRGQLLRWYNELVMQHAPPADTGDDEPDPWTEALRDLAQQ